MADNTVKIRLEAEGIDSLEKLNAKIKETKTILDTAKFGSEEHKRATQSLNELKAAYEQITNPVKALKDRIVEIRTEWKNQTITADQANQKLAAVREQITALGPSVRGTAAAFSLLQGVENQVKVGFTSLATEITQINDKLPPATTQLREFYREQRLQNRTLRETSQAVGGLTSLFGSGGFGGALTSSIGAMNQAEFGIAGLGIAASQAGGTVGKLGAGMISLAGPIAALIATGAGVYAWLQGITDRTIKANQELFDLRVAIGEINVAGNVAVLDKQIKEIEDKLKKTRGATVANLGGGLAIPTEGIPVVGVIAKRQQQEEATKLEKELTDLQTKRTNALETAGHKELDLVKQQFDVGKATYEQVRQQYDLAIKRTDELILKRSKDNLDTQKAETDRLTLEKALADFNKANADAAQKAGQKALDILKSRNELGRVSFFNLLDEYDLRIKNTTDEQARLALERERNGLIEKNLSNAKSLLDVGSISIGQYASILDFTIKAETSEAKKLDLLVLQAKFIREHPELERGKAPEAQTQQERRSADVFGRLGVSGAVTPGQAIKGPPKDEKAGGGVTATQDILKAENEINKFEQAADQSFTRMNQTIGSTIGKGLVDAFGIGHTLVGQFFADFASQALSFVSSGILSGLFSLIGGGGFLSGFLGAFTNKRASGGWINEEVRGFGMKTGQKYLIGESGPEYVSPVREANRTAMSSRMNRQNQTVTLNLKLDSRLRGRDILHSIKRQVPIDLAGAF